jgi:hypothetical protein
MSEERGHGRAKEAADAATYDIFNRNYNLLELVVTPTKQSREPRSNRDKIVTPIHAD